MIEEVTSEHIARIPNERAGDAAWTLSQDEFDRKLVDQGQSFLHDGKLELAPAARDVQQLNVMAAVGKNNLAFAAAGDPIVYPFLPKIGIRRIFH